MRLPGYQPTLVSELATCRADLKHAGFLTRDARVVERKSAASKKARRAPRSSKR
ncbi:MAG: 30S ribosomal protein S9 [Collinsella sp.]